MKICKGTKVITGCGWPKSEEEFQKTKNGRMAVCRECLQSYRHGNITIRRKHETSEESELFNQFDKLKRG